MLGQEDMRQSETEKPGEITRLFLCGCRAPLNSVEYSEQQRLALAYGVGGLALVQITG